MKTNLLTAVTIAKKFEPDWKAAIRLSLRVATMYPFGVWPGAGNRAKRRIAAL